MKNSFEIDFAAEVNQQIYWRGEGEGKKESYNKYLVFTFENNVQKRTRRRRKNRVERENQMHVADALPSTLPQTIIYRRKKSNDEISRWSCVFRPQVSQEEKRRQWHLLPTVLSRNDPESRVTWLINPTMDDYSLKVRCCLFARRRQEIDDTCRHLLTKQHRRSSFLL